MKNRMQTTGQVKITAKQYREMIFGKLNPKQPKSRFRSEWEREFAQFITAEGWPWKYEAVRLRLADHTTYLTDFWVPWPGQKIEVYEVKGWRRQAGIIKFKVAKEQYPELKFYMVTKNKIGGWCIT